MFQYPFAKDVRLNVDVRGRIVHHDKGRFVCWADTGQLIQKLQNMLTADAVVADFKVQLRGSVIQRANTLTRLRPTQASAVCIWPRGDQLCAMASVSFLAVVRACGR